LSYKITPFIKNRYNQQQSHVIPRQTTINPIRNNQPVKGRSITSNIPKPKPIKQTAKVFLKILKIQSILSNVNRMAEI